mgnify:FL=1|tara:strand:- start:3161 stop:4018 length:858 start_codon:yes stop_codon:yes gene_type:complete
MRKIKTTRIGSKDYVDVSERVIAFNDLYPIESGYSLRQEIVSVNEETGTVLMHAWVENAEGKILRDGHAHEFQANKKSKVNMTSHIENCETSAVGRALGFMGLGTEHGIASADEVRNAQAKEAEMKALEDKQPEESPKATLTKGASAMEEEPKQHKKPELVYKAKEKPYINPKTLVSEATEEQIEAAIGKPVTTSTTPSSTKEAEEILDDAESEEEYLVELNRRVSVLKNDADAKALAEEGRKWSNNWQYKKEQYKSLYDCINKSFQTFKKKQDTAKSASLKGGS